MKMSVSPDPWRDLSVWHGPQSTDSRPQEEVGCPREHDAPSAVFMVAAYFRLAACAG